MYLKAAKLAEAMQDAITSSQLSGRSASPEAVSHGKLCLLYTDKCHGQAFDLCCCLC